MSFDARPPIRRLAALVGVAGLALAGILVVGQGTPSSASTADEATLVSLVNGARSAAGLPPLTVSGALTATARAHSADMAAAGTLFHSVGLAGTIGDSVAGWTSLAENVGVGSSATEVHQALMASSAHRGHILGDFNLLGVGVVQGGDGRIWVTEHFAKAPAPSTSTSTAPVTTTTTTTTTTVAVAPLSTDAGTESIGSKGGRSGGTQVRTSSARTPAGGPVAPTGDDVSCLPPPAQDHGEGFAYGRCEEGPAPQAAPQAAGASDGQGRPGG